MVRRFAYGKLAVAVVAACLHGASAEAITITLTPTETDSFVPGGCTPTCLLEASGGGTYVDIWGSPAGPSTAKWVLSGLSYAFLGSDSFAVSIFNSDASTWSWQAVVHTSAGDFLTQFETISHGLSAILVTLPFGVSGTITGIDVIVSGDTLALHDNTVNFTIDGAAIPEPGTLLLLGTGLLGVAYAARRRRNG